MEGTSRNEKKKRRICWCFLVVCFTSKRVGKNLLKYPKSWEEFVNFGTLTRFGIWCDFGYADAIYKGHPQEKFFSLFPNHKGSCFTDHVSGTFDLHRNTSVFLGWYPDNP